MRLHLAMLLLVAAALVLSACGSEPRAIPATTQPSPEPPAPVATAVAQAEATVAAAFDKSGTARCHRLCQPAFWLDASVADVESELSRGADLAARNYYGATPLHYAALLGDLPVVEALLNRGAEIDAKTFEGVTPLYVAATGSRGLLIRGIFKDQTPDVIALLLENGADANVRSNWGGTPLIEARDPAAISLLLSYGADIHARNENGETALLNVISADSAIAEEPAAIALLLENGADVNVRNQHGATPLYYTASSDASPDLVTILEVITVLLKYGADVTALDDYGKTACQYAMGEEGLERKPEEVIRLLCQ